MNSIEAHKNATRITEPLLHAKTLNKGIQFERDGVKMRWIH